MLLNKNSTRIKLIDFGLAQMIGPNSNIRAMMGTAEFIGWYSTLIWLQHEMLTYFYLFCKFLIVWIIENHSCICAWKYQPVGKPHNKKKYKLVAFTFRKPHNEKKYLLVVYTVIHSQEIYTTNLTFRRNITGNWNLTIIS